MCQGAGVAVVGLYPILFPPNGYHGQLSWMANSCAVIGPESYNRLQAASREGVIKLPRNITLTTSSGHTINIGPNLTIPNTQKMAARFPLITVQVEEVYTEVSSSAKSRCGEDEVVNKIAEEVLDSEELNMIEEVETELEEEKKDSKNMRGMRTLDVEVSPVITKEDLLAHFSSFGEVESVHFPSEHEGLAAVTFSSRGSVDHCLSLVHQIVHNFSDDSTPREPIQLRLKGGEGHRPPPPRQLQLNVNPFR